MFQVVKRNAEEDKTVHWKITSLGREESGITRDPAAVTPFGLMVFFEFLRRIGYCEAVREHLPFSLRSPNAIDPVKTFTAFLLSVVAGARRLAHTSLLRADTALHALLGISRFPIDDTVRNLFKRFGQGQCQRFFSGLGNWQFERLPECAAGYSLDLDSRCSSATVTSKVRCAAPTRANMAGLRIIPWWRCWPKRTFSCTAGCAAATAAPRAGWWSF